MSKAVKSGIRLSWMRWILACIVMFGGIMMAPSSVLGWQDTGLEDPLASESTKSESSSSDNGSNDEPEEDASGQNMLTMMFKGGILGVMIVIVILILSLVSVAFIIEHFITISKNRLMPEHVLVELEQRIARGEINHAVEFCHMPENYSLSSEVILAGLERFQGSEFGFAEYKSAVEEAGEDQTGKLYRKTEVLNVIGSIAPMLGLTGTVVGMISAFTTMSRQQDGFASPEQLAGGIGQALITTLLGLLVAIPTMVALSYFRAKIDSLVAEAGKRIERIMMPLGRKR